MVSLLSAENFLADWSFRNGHLALLDLGANELVGGGRGKVVADSCGGASPCRVDRVVHIISLERRAWLPTRSAGLTYEPVLRYVCSVSLVCLFRGSAVAHR